MACRPAARGTDAGARAPAAGQPRTPGLPLPQPRDLAPRRDALFLDFDGTLVDIAPTPDSVRPAPGLPDLLDALSRRLGGALAIVTGRPVEAVDRFLSPLRLPVAGLHGRDRRLADGSRERGAVDRGAVDAARVRLRALAERWPGTVIEDKGESVALHYRQAPEAGAAALEEALAIEAGSGGALRLVPGKMVVELVPAGADKGAAVLALLDLPPFRGRVPVFAGDDVTDEAGFAAVNRLGGLSVRVGPAPGATSAARAAVPDVPALHAWLARAVAAAQSEGE
jgi:trehalose 6-phosphate phosphatase